MKHIISSIKVIGLLLIITSLFSCSAEKKLAIEFARNQDNGNVLVLAPDYLYKANLKAYLLDSVDYNRNDDKDSVLLVHSDYLNDLNDSLFIANYILGYTKTLNKLGFRVFMADEADEFMAMDSNIYQINIAQVELEETIYTYRDEAQVYDSYFFHDHNLNAVYVNSWFEFSDLNEVSSEQQIYFTTDLITDIPDGSFDYDILSGKVRYMYNIDSLEVNELYGFAFRIGEEYAKYTFDMMLNKELDSKLTPEMRSENYWRYDPDKNYFYPAMDDRFVPLD